MLEMMQESGWSGTKDTCCNNSDDKDSVSIAVTSQSLEVEGGWFDVFTSFGRESF